jgi:hypothetical protein
MSPSEIIYRPAKTPVQRGTTKDDDVSDHISSAEKGDFYADRDELDREESTMGIRASVSVVLLAVVLGAAYACSSQPTAPSRLDAARPSGLAAAPSLAASTQAVTASPARFGDRTPGIVYVTSQGLYYDTFVVKDPLPMHGKFQLLSDGRTEFGPGQPGYLGGRWWVDEKANGVQDPEDHFFLCPLLPPGRPTP